MKAGGFIAVLALILVVSACTFRGTTKETTDTIRNTTISTSGKTWLTEDGLVKNGQEAAAFADLNFENVKQDMAVGQGEYLGSLAALLGVPEDYHGDFFTVAQQSYPTLTRQDQATPKEFLSELNKTMAAHAIPTAMTAKK
jgi:hypothetical protein